MEFFCGALDTERREVDFSVLRRMCGARSTGSAYINGELGMLCATNDLSEGALRPVTVRRGEQLYTAVILADVPEPQAETASAVLEGYIDEGERYISRLDLPFTLALYDGRCGELYLCVSHGSQTLLYTARRHGTIYFATSPTALYTLFCGSVRVRESALKEYILGAECRGVLCDIERIERGSGVMVTRMGEGEIALYGRAEGERRVRRGTLDEQLWECGYPYYEPPVLDKKRQKGLERALDARLAASLADPACRACEALARSLTETLDKQKSTPHRIRVKGMLCQTLEWSKRYNIVLV